MSTEIKQVTVVDEENCTDFNVVLTYMGEFGCYQKYLLVILFPFLFAWAYIYLRQTFIVIVPPDYWCYVPELSHLSKDQQLNLAIPKNSNDNFEKCSMYDVNYTYVLEVKITEANTSWPQKPCHKWVYDKRQLPYETIATKYNWVCEHEDLRIHSTTIYLCGAVVGGFILGYATDHWGRIPTVLISNIFALVGGLGSAVSTSFFSFAVTRFLVGSAFHSCFSPIYILVMEYLGPKYRTFVTNFSIGVYFTTGAVLLPWSAYWCNNWRLLAFLTSIPILIPLLLLIFVSESARWMVTGGNIKKAIKIIEKVAKKNRKTIPADILESFQLCCELKYNQSLSNKRPSILALFKSKTFLRIILILCGTWMISSLLYNAHVRIIMRAGPELFYTYSMVCLMEIPASFILMILLNFSGRKKMSVIAFAGCALGSFYSAMLNEKWSIAFTSIVCRSFTTMNYNICLQWTVELLPTVLRGQGLAFVQLTRCILILSPFIARTEYFYRSIPMIISGLLSTIAAILVCFLPETNGYDLPQKLDEAEELWNKQKIIPWRKRRYANEMQN